MSINSAVNHRTSRARPKVTLFGDTFYTHSLAPYKHTNTYTHAPYTIYVYDERHTSTVVGLGTLPELTLVCI